VPTPIVIPFLSNQIVPRDLALFIMVATDLCVIFLLYFSTICFKSFQERTGPEIKESLLTADDFTLCINNIPLNAS